MSRGSLTIQSAHAASGLVAVSYVGILYLIPSARTRPWEKDQNGRKRDRLHPDIIKVRLWATSFSAITSIILVGILLSICRSSPFDRTVEETLILVGLRTKNVKNSLELIRIFIQPLILTAILFWGPLSTRLVLEGNDSKEETSSKSESWKDIIDIYVLRVLILGPLLEEIVFRGCIIAFHLLVSSPDRLSKTQLIFLSPLWFGLAHVHGIWEVYLSRAGTRNALIFAIVQSSVQFLYTTLFGWYAAFVHLRTGSVIASTLCHSFCNYMGLPPFFESLNRFPNRRMTIILHHVIGVIIFSWLLHQWASDSTLFPDSVLWINSRKTLNTS